MWIVQRPRNSTVTGILDSRTLRKKQCTLKGGWYVNVQDSEHWEGVYSVGECGVGVQIFFNSSMKLTNQKRPKVTYLIHH